jgi:hypothetical protein
MAQKMLTPRSVETNSWLRWIRNSHELIFRGPIIFILLSFAPAAIAIYFIHLVGGSFSVGAAGVDGAVDRNQDLYFTAAVMSIIIYPVFIAMSGVARSLDLSEPLRIHFKIPFIFGCLFSALTILALFLPPHGSNTPQNDVWTGDPFIDVVMGIAYAQNILISLGITEATIIGGTFTAILCIIHGVSIPRASSLSTRAIFINLPPVTILCIAFCLSTEALIFLGSIWLPLKLLCFPICLYVFCLASVSIYVAYRDVFLGQKENTPVVIAQNSIALANR